ncbi:FG-GAP repeat domain-containing protein [Flagellimonas crocea]|uniref:FG-GAP repeat domain-containing protein n=1 Tax=Flagellimonas crocea TaxID=3067311 RepID=UPI002970055A|nr:VCBS repeat-containing protein [Muricauda sp. DH64]
MKKILVPTITLTFLIFSSSIFCQEVSFFNADGFFSIGTKSNRTASITLFDIDQDGDLDALVANGRHWAEQNYIFYNDGNGFFKVAQPIGRFMDASYAIKAGDLNGDGFMDIAVANDNVPNTIYFGTADQSFINGTTFGSIAPSRNLEIVDMDNDGDLDLVLSNRKARNEICLNDGRGNFSQTVPFGDKLDQTIQTRTMDINKDGFVDLVTAERQSYNKIYLNDGKLNFSKFREFGGDEEETRSIDIADIDQDGFLDIVTGNLGSKNSIYFGDKNMSFSKTIDLSTNHMTASIRIADLDQDGHLDIIEGNSEERNYVYLGQSNGTYLEIGLREDLLEDTYNIEIGDLNQDGLPDIVESNSGTWNLYYRTRKKQP